MRKHDLLPDDQKFDMHPARWDRDERFDKAMRKEFVALGVLAREAFGRECTAYRR